MKRIFLLGPLLDPELRRIVLGDTPPAHPAVLPDHALEMAEEGDEPVLVKRAGARAEGLIVDLDAERAARSAFHEAGHGRVPRSVEAMQGDEAVAVEIHGADAGAGAGRDWSLARWQAAAGPLARRTAEVVMASVRRVPHEELRFRRPMIRARADAALRAEAEPMPTALRAGLHRDTVEVVTHRQPYCHYFAVGETRLSHPLFDGGMGDVVERAGLQMTDAVTVLPYDPVRDTVMVVEQFRYGPWLRGDPHPWVLEPVAGRIDPGETAEATARREAQEEAGIEIGALHRIGSYYPSPGGVSEYIESFVGIADLPDRAGGLGGLDAENEDIRSHVIGFDRAMNLVRSGEVDTAPLMLSLMWLEAARNRGAFA